MLTRRPMLTRRAGVLAMIGAVVAAVPVAGSAETMTAPDVVVYCDATIGRALEDAGRDFRSRTTVPVRVFSLPGPQALALIARGARNDVVVTQAGWLDHGATDGLVKPETRVGSWHDPTVLAGRDAAALPGLPTPAALSALLAGSRLGVIDPTHDGGPDGVALAGRLGWQATLAGAIDGPGVAFLVRNGEAGLGLLPRSSVMQRPALAVIATVPDTVAPPVDYAAAASKNALSRNTAAFLDYLKSPSGAAILRDAGLEAAA